MNTARPCTTKGIGFTTPKGKALWCGNTEPQRKFNEKGDLMTNLVLDPSEAEVKEFIKALEDLRDTAYEDTIKNLGSVKGKQVKKRDVTQADVDQNGNETGLVVIKMKLKDVDEKKELGRQFQIDTFDAKKNKLDNPPRVGNGSIIRCAGYANPYYMASTKEVGVSLIWQKLQIIDLVEIGGGDSFGEEDGFVASATPQAYKDDFSEAPF